MRSTMRRTSFVEPEDRTERARRLFDLGRAHHALREHALAISDYTACLELGSTRPEVYNNRAICYLMTGDLPKALADWRAALRIDPAHLAARHNARRLARALRGRRPVPRAG